MMRTRAGFWAAVGASAIVLTGCGEVEDSGPTLPETGVATSTGDAAARTTSAPDVAVQTVAKAEKTPAAPSATQAPRPTAPEAKATPLPRDVEEYADRWVRAYGLGDDDVMQVYADRAVHDVMAGRSGGPGWTRTETRDLPSGEKLVVYVHNRTQDHLGLVVDPAKVGIGAEHAVVDLLTGVANSEWGSLVRPDQYYWGAYGSEGQPDPEPPTEDIVLTTDRGTYADEFVRAWGAGDRTAAEPYAAAGGMGLFSHVPVGGPKWTRAQVTDAGVEYSNPDGGWLVVVLDPALVSVGAPDAITLAYVEYE